MIESLYIYLFIYLLVDLLVCCLVTDMKSVRYRSVIFYHNLNTLQEGNRFHEDIFGVTLRSSEVTDRARDQAKRAWNFINSASKKRGSIDKGTVTPLPSGVSFRKGCPAGPVAPTGLSPVLRGFDSWRRYADSVVLALASHPCSRVLSPLSTCWPRD